MLEVTVVGVVLEGDVGAGVIKSQCYQPTFKRLILAFKLHKQADNSGHKQHLL